MTERIIKKLIEFRQKDKFSYSEWEKRGLNPSRQEIIDKMDTSINRCIDEVIEQVQKRASQKELILILKKGVSRLDKREYDTEEKEFICDCFYQLSQIIGVDIKNILNKWLYGSFLAIAIKFFSKREKVKDIITQNCTSCESKLETFILKRRVDIQYESFIIVKCKNCEEYNLLDLGKGIDSLRYGEYVLIEQLDKTEFTNEQAEIRLEQIKYFRK